jgi:hypothetical protein
MGRIYSNSNIVAALIGSKCSEVLLWPNDCSKVRVEAQRKTDSLADHPPAYSKLHRTGRVADYPPPYSKLHSLALDSYWTRKWIIQEVLVARTVVLMAPLTEYRDMRKTFLSHNPKAR